MELWNNILSNPFVFVSIFLSFFAAFGVLIFIRGFSGSIKHLLTLTGHDEHVHHANVRVIWGVLILTTAFIVWEIIRWLIGLL